MLTRLIFVPMRTSRYPLPRSLDALKIADTYRGLLPRIMAWMQCPGIMCYRLFGSTGADCQRPSPIWNGSNEDLT